VKQKIDWYSRRSVIYSSVILKSSADDFAWLSETLSGEPQDGGAIDEAVYGGNSDSFGIKHHTMPYN